MRNELKTTIGLEIHVQLATKSKMFCRCDNNAEGKEPNTLVCPTCLGLPGALPVANKQAILWTIRTGLALNCQIPKIAKFDRKHYFYPDLPKGYQISQYDEPFCLGGFIEVDKDVIPAEAGISKIPDHVRDEKAHIRLNRIHLEEDAGKLIHSNGKSLVDLNRSGTPLMEIVTEPDITSPKQAGDFLRKLQKIVRDVVSVSEASMEKGHLRCDANISITDGEKMSEIVELKNINSFKFIEKALSLEEARLKAEYPNWPEKRGKVTRGYDSKSNKTYEQRRKEEAADYRYFPEPDLPPIDSSGFDLEALSKVNISEDEELKKFLSFGVTSHDANTLISNREKNDFFNLMLINISKGNEAALSRAIVHDYFGFQIKDLNRQMIAQYVKAIEKLAEGDIDKQKFNKITSLIHEKNLSFEEANSKIGKEISEQELENIVDRIIAENSSEVQAYLNGKIQLMGFFIGQVMKLTGGRVNPRNASAVIVKRIKSKS